MTTHINGNGNNKLVLAILLLLISTLVGGAGSWLWALTTKINEVDNLQRLRGERVSMLEAKIAVQEGQLARIEKKLDELIQRKNKE